MLSSWILFLLEGTAVTTMTDDVNAATGWREGRPAAGDYNLGGKRSANASAKGMIRRGSFSS